MNNKKKYVAVLSSAALGALIVSAITTTPVSAKTVGFLARDTSGKYYEYNYNELTDSAVQKAMSSPAPLYDDYIAKTTGTNKLVAFKDDVKGYVNEQAVIAASTAAAISGQKFDLDNYTEKEAKSTDVLANVTNVSDLTVKDGKVVTVDPSQTVESVSPITVSDTTVGVVPTLPTTANVTLGDGTTKAANITWNAAATTASTYANTGKVTIRGALADYNNYSVTATVNVNGAGFDVDSIAALNMKQIKVVFNNPVNKTTAETIGNYTLTPVAGAAGNLTSATAKVQADGKTVIITLDDHGVLGRQGSYKLDVKDVQDTSGDVLASTEKSFSVLDTALPQAQSAALINPNQVKVTFSAPIQTTLTTDYLLDNGQYSITKADLNAADDSVTLTLGAALPAGAHSLVIAPENGTAPVAYNGFSAANQTLNFNAVVDTTAPTVSVSDIELASTTSTKVQFKFNKPVALNTAHFFYGYDKSGASNIGTLDNGTSNNGVEDTTGIDASASKFTIGTTTYADTYDVVFKTALPTGATTFYVDNDADATTPATTNYVTDAWGNKFVSTSVTGNLVMDTTKPTATSVVMDTQSTATSKIDVTFNKAVAANATDGTNYVLKDSQGNVVTSTTLSGAKLDYSGHPTSISAGSATNEYVIDLGTKLKAGTYTLTVSGVKDNVLPVANTMDSKTYTLTIADTTAPTVSTVTYNTAQTKLFVYYSKAMAVSGTGSIVDVANYQLGGNALPTGTTISAMDNNTIAVITLPTAETPLADLTVGAVKDSAGNTISGLAQTIKSGDMKADSLTSSDIVSGSAKTISEDTVTFEVNQPLSAINASDFTIDGALAGNVSYNNQLVNNGTQNGALVTVKAGKTFSTKTSATGLAVNLAAGALTNTNGTTSSAISITTIADKVAPVLSSASVDDVTTTPAATIINGTVTSDGKSVTVDVSNVATGDQLNNVNVALSEDGTISVPTETIGSVTIPAQTISTKSDTATITLASLVGVPNNGSAGVSEGKLKQLVGANTSISIPVTVIDSANNVTNGTITITGLH